MATIHSMKIAKGTSRIAISCENYTAKLPRFHPDALRILPTRLKEFFDIYHLKGEFLRKYFLNPEDENAFQKEQIRGLLANLRESKWSKALGNLVVPTRYSFLGLVNIQETAKVPQLPENELRKLARTLRGNPDPHTFHEPGNYGLHDGQLKLLDYGEYGVAQFLFDNRQRVETFLRALEDIAQ